MQTLALYDMIKSAFEYIIKESDTSTKAAYESALKDAETKVSEIARRLRCIDPILTPYTLPLLGETGMIDETEVPVLMESIKESSRKRQELGIVYSGASFTKVVQRTAMEFPQFVDFEAKPHVLIRPYEDQGWEDFAVKMMNQILLGCLLTMPKGTVRINFINPSLSSKSSFLSSKLSSDLCRVFVDRKEIHEFMSLLVNRIKDILKGGDKTSVDNTIAHELVVLLDYPYQYDGITEDMRIVIEQGQQAGIHFIVLNDLRQNFDNDRAFNILTLKDRFFQEPDAFYVAKKEDYDKYLCRTYQLCNQPALLNACLEYLKEDTDRKNNQYEINKGQDFVVAEDEICLTIGSDINNREEITLRFNSKDYIHAFILGKSGSGKSVLLNNIIISAINKYSPEDLMLYLLDFKRVEFNCYKGIKHAKAILVDNSDTQMTLEILKELENENQRREILLSEEGDKTIDSYNRKHPDSKIPMILFVADECQVMFKQSKWNIQNEIADSLITIATRGRSQGIHMILATQSLEDVDIPGQILNNLTECILLNSESIDSEKLVKGSSELSYGQPIGQCYYYHNKKLYAHMKTFYSTENEIKSAIESSRKKSENHIDYGGAYFCGKSKIWLDDTEKAAIIQASSKYPIAALGHNIGLRGGLTTIQLLPEFSENVLFFGINKEEQTVGVMINALMSLIISYQQLGKTCDFIIIDCLNDEEARYRSLLEAMESEGMCKIVERPQSGTLFMQLVNDICNHYARPTVLGIIGSNQFIEIKRNTPLPSSQIQESESNLEVISIDYSTMPDLFPNNSLDSSRIKTYQDALMFILDEGPLQDIHVLLQVDKPENILFNGEWCPEVTDKFRHKVILRSENKYLAPMRFSVDIDVEALNKEEERLRAYYYPDNGEPKLFTPYIMPKSKKIINSLTIKNTITWE